ncbi:MAG TPA: iron ABC transporter permease, partial [Halomonas sp.]|nr:iron ABC transporter permease [Halomonas sp.]
MKMTAKQSMSGVVLPRTSTAYQEEVSAQAVAAPQGYWRAALPRYGVSVLLEKRAVAVNIGLSAALLAACVLYLSLGSVTLSPNAVVASLVGQGDSMTAFMVQQLRLPRLIAACFTGAAFALAGVLMQTLARNRLATPGIIGIDNGATAFAVASIVGLGVGIAPPAMALA